VPGVSEDRIDDLQTSLRALRKQVDQLGRQQQATASELRRAVLAAAVAGAMLILTATTWRTRDGGSADEVDTLWDMVPTIGLAAVTLVLVAATGLGSLAAFLTGAGRRTHVVLVVLSLLVVGAVLLVGAARPAGSFDPEDYASAPGRWLALLAALVLAGLHGSRAGELRR
jgi:outer membrane murein-binding lipoprotein Lpp